MAKSKSGGTRSFIRGSVGSETYSIGLDGKGKKQQIIRAKATEVANPRTRAQAAQRMKLMPITYARQIMSDIVNHSFKGIPTGPQSLQYFVGINLKETDVPYQTKGSLNREIGGYTIAEGTLADLRASFENVPSGQGILARKTLPGLETIHVPLYTSADGRPASYAEWCQKLLEKNSWLKAGDEIATIVFVGTASGSNHGVKMVRHRLIIDPDFTTDTPAQFTAQLDAGGGNVTPLPLNALYAMSQWNDDVLDLLEGFKAAAVTDGTAIGVTKIVMTQYMGLYPNTSNGHTILAGFTDLHSMDVEPAFVESVDKAFAAGVNIGFAIIVSRFENGNWDFTTSDICLDFNYLQAVSSESRLAAAIASYMAGEVVRAGQDQFFLRLDDGNTIPAAPLTIRASVGTGNYTSLVNVQGYTDPTTGKKYAVINDDNKLLQYVGGPIVQGPITLEESGDMSVENWKSPVDINFIKESAVLSSN